MTMNSTLTALCLLCLIVGPILAKRAPCETGKKRYSEAKGRCVRCKCRRGYQQTFNADIPYDKRFGALQCPNCIRCDPGFYSNRQTDSVCVECSTPCGELNRLTDVPCDGRRNTGCGKCKDGYFEWLKGDVSCTPCGYNLDRPECKNGTVISTASPVSSVTESESRIPKYIDKIQTSTLGWSLPLERPRGSGMILVILCVVAVVLSILILFIVYKVVNKCWKLPSGNHHHFGSRSTNTTVSSASLLKGGMGNDLEMDTQICGDMDNTGRISGLDDDTINKMRSTEVKRDGSLLRTIATKIDKDPTSAFEYLGIGNNVIFQEEKNQKIYKQPVAEYYLSVLKKWVEKNGKEARKSILYTAFWNAEMYSVCEFISREDES